eukprot:15436628-Alexandrium_andersonii.AAC.1
MLRSKRRVFESVADRGGCGVVHFSCSPHSFATFRLLQLAAQELRAELEKHRRPARALVHPLSDFVS